MPKYWIDLSARNMELLVVGQPPERRLALIPMDRSRPMGWPEHEHPDFPVFVPADVPAVNGTILTASEIWVSEAPLSAALLRRELWMAEFPDALFRDGADLLRDVAVPDVEAALALPGSNFPRIQSPTARKTIPTIPDALRPFLSQSQARATTEGLRGEEGAFFAERMDTLAKTIAVMPKTYESDGKGDQAIVHLHYFHRNADWYITEKDSDLDGTGQVQAFGLADLGMDLPELGYINLQEITRFGAEMDYHFAPRSLLDLKLEKYPEMVRSMPVAVPVAVVPAPVEASDISNLDMDRYVLERIRVASAITMAQASNPNNSFEQFMQGHILATVSDALLSVARGKTSLPKSGSDEAKRLMRNPARLAEYQAHIGRVLYDGAHGQAVESIDQPDAAPMPDPTTEPESGIGFGTTDPVARGMLKRIDASPYTMAYLLGQWRMTDDNGWTGGTVEELYAWESAQNEFADELDAILNARIQQNELAMAEKGWRADTLHDDLTRKPFVGSVIHLEPDLNAMGYMLGLTYQIIQDGKLEQSLRDTLDSSSTDMANALHTMASEANTDAAERAAAALSGDPYPDEPKTLLGLKEIATIGDTYQRAVQEINQDGGWDAIQNSVALHDRQQDALDHIIQARAQSVAGMLIDHGWERSGASFQRPDLQGVRIMGNGTTSRSGGNLVKWGYQLTVDHGKERRAGTNIPDDFREEAETFARSLIQNAVEMAARVDNDLPDDQSASAGRIREALNQSIASGMSLGDLVGGLRAMDINAVMSSDDINQFFHMPVPADTVLLADASDRHEDTVPVIRLPGAMAIVAWKADLDAYLALQAAEVLQAEDTETDLSPDNQVTMDTDLMAHLRERASIRDGSHPNWSGLSDSVANAQEFVRQHAMRNPEVAEKWAADLRGNPFEYGEALGLESDNIRGIATLMEESVKRARHPVIGDLVRFDPYDQNPLKGSVFSGRVIAALDTGGGDVRYHLRAETGPDQGMEGTVYGKNGSFRLIHLIQAHGFERNAESVAPKVSRGDYVRYRDETGAEREGVVLDAAQPGEATRLRGIYRWPNGKPGMNGADHIALTVLPNDLMEHIPDAVRSGTALDAVDPLTEAYRKTMGIDIARADAERSVLNAVEIAREQNEAFHANDINSRGGNAFEFPEQRDTAAPSTISDPIVIDGKSIGTMAFLEERFGSDAAFGVRYADENTGQAIPADELSSFDGAMSSTFPDGGITNCTNYARNVQKALPAGAVRVVGFSNEKNPDSDVVREGWHPGGHDFAIVDNRYLVDPWAKLLAGVRDRVVYDLQNDQDARVVAQTYGDSAIWSELPETGVINATTIPQAPLAARHETSSAQPSAGKREDSGRFIPFSKKDLASGRLLQAMEGLQTLSVSLREHSRSYNSEMAQSIVDEAKAIRRDDILGKREDRLAWLKENNHDVGQALLVNALYRLIPASAASMPNMALRGKNRNSPDEIAFRAMAYMAVVEEIGKRLDSLPVEMTQRHWKSWLINPYLNPYNNAGGKVESGLGMVDTRSMIGGNSQLIPNYRSGYGKAVAVEVDQRGAEAIRDLLSNWPGLTPGALVMESGLQGKGRDCPQDLLQAVQQELNDRPGEHTPSTWERVTGGGPMNRSSVEPLAEVLRQRFSDEDTRTEAFWRNVSENLLGPQQFFCCYRATVTSHIARHPEVMDYFLENKLLPVVANYGYVQQVPAARKEKTADSPAGGNSTAKIPDAQWKDQKKSPDAPYGDIARNVAPNGIDPSPRNGRNVTDEEFVRDTGFSVQYGNYVNNKERQALLNMAYDGLHDMAAVLDVPIASLAVRKDGVPLALALGARGSGRALAHYESGTETHVINLTKTKGAGGVMIHEWLHAVDATMAKQTLQGMTDRSGPAIRFASASTFGGKGFASHAPGNALNDFVRLAKLGLHLSQPAGPARVQQINLPTEQQKGIPTGHADKAARMTELWRDRLVGQWITPKLQAAFTARLDEYLKYPHADPERKALLGDKTAADYLPLIRQRIEDIAQATAEGIATGSNRRALAAFTGAVQFWTNMGGARAWSYDEGGPVHNKAAFQKMDPSLNDEQARVVGFAFSERFFDTARSAFKPVQRYASECHEMSMKSDFYGEASMLDAGRKTPYWSSPHELLARGGSAVFYDLSRKMGIHNDFLDAYSTPEMFSGPDFKGNPNPEGAEREALVAHFEQQTLPALRSFLMANLQKAEITSEKEPERQRVSGSDISL